MLDGLTKKKSLSHRYFEEQSLYQQDEFQERDVNNLSYTSYITFYVICEQNENFYSTVVPLYIRKFPYQTVYHFNCTTTKLSHWLPPRVHEIIVHLASDLTGTNSGPVTV